ncbi:hypothetical protein CLV97_1519 [Planifilum fimeticola]|jgi:hypothetical protein|uniref:Uncharacterized protein n=1 Tax=Planifilum fimeticola TaxID=201975 RepID=A0A2T0LA14_9BACL|nr:hypothetical protein [Planifilum fimeticola]PRX38535.1 hypothetical protein CLV97_1519 [Planifilum fimeticola]
MNPPIKPQLKRSKPLPSIPEEVMKTAAAYKRVGETENVGSFRALVSGKIYYYSTYVQGELNDHKRPTGYLVIRGDGSVPPLSEAKKPLRMINSTDGILREILLNGPSLANRPTDNWEGLEELLSRISNMLKCPLPADVQQALEVFRSIPERVLDKQREIREIVLNGEKLFEELTTDYLITDAFYEKVESEFYRYVECQFVQHDIQVTTYPEREKFLQYLSSVVSITNFSLWRLYRSLKKHHHAMTITDKRDLEAHEDVRNDLRRDKNTEKHFEMVFNLTRNSRDE